METLRVGLVGCGVIGGHHAQVAAEAAGIELVAVADLIEERGRAAAEKHGVPRVYVEGRDLIDDPDLDLVILAFPTCGRTELGLRALRAGKHLLTEKPVAMNVEEVDQLLAARGDRQVACCSSRFRLTAAADAAREFLASGALGELRVVRCRNLVPGRPPTGATPPDWRLKRALNGGGILVNWGCYDIDFLLGLLGWRLRPRSVLACCWTCPPAFGYHQTPGSDAETHYLAAVTCDDNVMLHLERAEAAPAAAHAAWEITGAGGTLAMTMTPTKSAELVFHRADPEQGVVSEVVWSGEVVLQAEQRGPLTDLANAIRTGGRPETGLEEARQVAAITEAIYRSAETGRPSGVG